MVFKRFSIIIIARTIVLCGSVFLLFYLISETVLVATTFIVAVLIVVQIYSIIHFVQKTNRDTARFFSSIKYSDFSQSFVTNIKGASFDELSSAFAGVMDQFKQTRREREENFRYLQTVVQHVGIGLMAYTSEGEVELLNIAAKRLLRVNTVKNIAELSSVNISLVEALEKIRSGDKILVKYADNNDLLQLSIYATEFKMRDKHYTLVSISNIQKELEEQQMEAWRNLIRVLTHEIMNSVTPIISLSSTANALVEDLDHEKHRQESDPLDDIKGALTTITKRSTGLLHFVDDYRNLSRIPTPTFSVVSIASVFQRLQQMFSEQAQGKKIEFITSVSPVDLEVTTDPELLEQVLINLVLNSMKALAGATSPRVRLVSMIDKNGNAIIQVVDNGHGIPEELYDKIFIPFFTTRKEGSGIGLSISQQIVRVLGGSIGVSTTPGGGATFTIRL